MAKIIGHRTLLAVIACLMVIQTHDACASGSNVVHVRFDTLTVKPGDTAIVNVLYTFDSAHPHNIEGFTAHFSYDTNEVFIDFITAGTASAGFWDTLGSRHGFAAFSTTGQELDLTNPILFRMRVFVNRDLGDTAFIRWDSTFPLFNDVLYGVDSIIEQDGWVRTADAKGHVSLSFAGDSLRGMYHDSVAFSAPVIVSDISGANLRKFQLRFVFDSRYLDFRGASDGSETHVDSVRERLDPIRGFDTVWLILSSRTHASIRGSDTLVNINLSAIAFAGWNCASLWDVKYTPLSLGALIGNVDTTLGTFCVFGGFDGVEIQVPAENNVLRVYPNPGRTYEYFAPYQDAQRYHIHVFDALGRCVSTQENFDNRFELPESLEQGPYWVTVEEAGSGLKRSARITVIR